MLPKIFFFRLCFQIARSLKNLCLVKPTAAIYYAMVLPIQCQLFCHLYYSLMNHLIILVKAVRWACIFITGRIMKIKSQQLFSYFNCQFFGKASAQDIFNCFIICMSPLETNLVFLRLLDEKRNNHEVDPLRDTCTCGLHVVHQSFHYGESLSGWNVKKIFSANHRVFQESLYCRASYESLTDAQPSE